MTHATESALEGKVHLSLRQAVISFKNRRPASVRASSGLNGAKPLAIKSALTKWTTSARDSRNSSANVVFPAPFGPAITMQRGFAREFSLIDDSFIYPILCELQPARTSRCTGREPADI